MKVTKVDALALSKSSYVLLIGLVTVGFIYVISVLVFYISARAKTFNRSFLNQFDDRHEGAFPHTRPSWLGFPDQGNGFYSRQLSYAQWFELNNARRVVYNFLDQITFFLVTSLVAGLTYPAVASGFLFLYCLGRIGFAFGYSMKGPNWRIPGALTLDVAIFGQLALALVASFD